MAQSSSLTLIKQRQSAYFKFVTRFDSIIVAFVVIATLKITHYTFSHPVGEAQYAMLANAFLHGHPWLDHYVYDALLYGGKYYLIEGPMPALLLAPLVALFGTSIDERMLAVVLAGIAVGTGWEIGKRLNISFAWRIATCGFLLLGTDLYWCAELGELWLLANVSAVAFTFLALLEIFGKRRAWLVALLAVCAAESRFPMVLAIPVYALLLASDPVAGVGMRRLRVYGTTLAAFVPLWIAYNLARWGVPYDIGYHLFYNQDMGPGRGLPTGFPFRLSYLPYQLYGFFVRAPELVLRQQEIQPPYLTYSEHGLALPWTSPALLLAFFAPTSRLKTLLWVATTVVSVPSLLYYLDGNSQMGMRHALDFEPFLFVLMLLAIRAYKPVWGGLLCAYSIFFGAWQVWAWATYVRPGYW